MYLTDFGLTSGSRADTEATKTGDGARHARLHRAGADPRGGIGPFTDVYSLGCMTVQLLTGEVPFPVDDRGGQAVGALRRAAAGAERARTGLGHGFDPVVARAMSKRPEDRYATAGEVAARCAALGRRRGGA